jgi:hypothetical protein
MNNPNQPDQRDRAEHGWSAPTRWPRIRTGVGCDRNCRWDLGLDGTDPTGSADRWRGVFDLGGFQLTGVATDYTEP